MKKLFTIVCTLLLGASLSFAQAASQGGDTTKTTTTTTTKKKTTKTKAITRAARRARRAPPPALQLPNKSGITFLPKRPKLAAFFFWAALLSAKLLHLSVVYT